MHSRVAKLAYYLIALLLAPIAVGDQLRPTVELLHWWKVPTEVQSIEIIQEAVKKRGGTMQTVTSDNFSAQRERVIERISLGFPPTVAQWHGGNDLEELRAFGALQALPDQWREQPLDTLLFPEIKANIEADGKLWALPVGIHVHNTMYYAKSLYQELGLPYPESWQAFLQQAKIIQQAGITPLSVSDEPWLLQMLFNAFLVDGLSQEEFYQYYDDHQSIQSLAPKLQPIFSRLRELRQYADEGHRGRTWSQAVEHFATGQAAALVMGDFGTPEIQRQGMQLERDFACALTPGANHMIYAFDVFAMMKVDNQALKAGQALLFDTVISPDVQRQYNAQKGSTPIRMDIDPSAFDSCTRWKYAALKEGHYGRILVPSNSNRLRRGAIEYAILQTWQHPEVPIEQVLSQLVSSVEASL